MIENYSFSWDWKSKPKFKHIIDTIRIIIDNGQIPYHYEIDTNSDQNGLLISCNKNLSKTEAFEIWSNLEFGE